MNEYRERNKIKKTLNWKEEEKKKINKHYKSEKDIKHTRK